MTPRLCFLSCHNFHAEIAAAVAAEGWDEVVAVPFPARCGRPPVSWDELRPLVPAGIRQVVILGRACLANLGVPPADWPPVRLVPVTQCFHLVAGEALVDAEIAAGTYLITPAWLSDWRGQLRAMGFAPEQSGEFLHDFARELVLLDTGIDPRAAARLSELHEAVSLPARRIPVGLDYTRQRLARLVLGWRLEEAQRATTDQARRHASELGDYVAAMDMLVRLARTQDETEAIDSIDDLMRMLFAPAALHYVKVENGFTLPRGPVPEEMLAALRGLQSDHDWTPDGQGFLLRIGHSDETLGLVAVDRLAFPAYRERYLNLALTVSGVCGLAIQNARNRRRVVEAGKMASLGIMVAGVAHEINTPLGVGLTAASTLRKQSQQLAESFAARSMTQSDLTRYLETAATGTGLICQNLERIGHLIDAFRQVAVAGKSQEKSATRLRRCIEDVVRSLGDHLPADRVTVRVDCPDDLEVESVTGDWVSIFTNLLGNSLKHGFKGRAHGVVDIRIAREAKKLRVDYRDDGVGMAPEALARIFDPFYTTDLQHGMGLGMHLVYNLVTHRMGGSIQCESTPGNGIHIRIETPS